MTTGHTTEHYLQHGQVNVLCLANEYVVTANYWWQKAKLWDAQTCLYTTVTTLCFFQSFVFAVDLLAECSVKYPSVAVMHGANVYFGCDDGVTMWDTATKATLKIVESTGSFAF